MSSWIIVASSNKTQAHQFRLQSSLALIGFGAVSSSIFIENDGLIIGVFVLISMIFIALMLDSYYLKEEFAWQDTSVYIDKNAIDIARIGIRSYEANGKKIYRPHQIYKSYLSKLDGISLRDFTTKMLRRVGFVVAISIGIFAGTKIDTSSLPPREGATKTVQERSLPPTLPKMQKLLQTPSES